ncbi:helix-turn-helix transcriptional regulator [Amycolatopsis sp. NPDC059021]|uniref:helix-turn-helix transcriptional regulator n=1 Tax=Amycolatopsis sp. NPDC059021 TaxID=3346704 RepID=UPI00366CB815
MSPSVEHLVHEFSEIGRQGDVKLHVLAAAVSRAIAPWVRHDGIRSAATDPARPYSMVSTGVWHGYEPEIGRGLLHDYYTGHDLLGWTELARRPVPVQLVGTGPGPHHEQARRVFDAHDVGAELRCVLRDRNGVWGTLALMRRLGTRPFDRDDAHRLAALTPAMIKGLRAFVTAGPLTPRLPALPTGVTILGPDNAVMSTTPQALNWIRHLKARDKGPEWIDQPGVMLDLAQQARAQGDHETALPAYCSPATVSGRWVLYQAQVLQDNDKPTGQVAFVYSAARGAELLPTFCRWYGITGREQQIIAELCDGAAPKQIARRLDLSVHTVNDHLKAAFRKTNAGGRDELLAALTT